MKNAYDQQYFIKRDHLDEHIAQSVVALAKKYTCKKILDVGCGTGQIVEYLNKKNIAAYGCDLQSEAVKIARTYNKPTTILKASATKLPFARNSFDMVISISVIEHLTKKQGEKFVQEAYRVLRPNGIIFLVTPNFNSPLRFIVGRQWFAYTDPTHVFFYTPSSLTNLLKKNMFLAVTCRLPSVSNIKTDLHIPGFLKNTPQFFKNFLNYLMISSPFSTWRDSFWIMGVK